MGGNKQLIASEAGAIKLKQLEKLRQMFLCENTPTIQQHVAVIMQLSPHMQHDSTVLSLRSKLIHILFLFVAVKII